MKKVFVQQTVEHLSPETEQQSMGSKLLLTE